MKMITIIYISMALFLFWLAFSIWKRGKVNWLAGYEPNKYDDVKIARVTGISLSLTGGIYLVCAILTELFTGIEIATFVVLRYFKWVSHFRSKIAGNYGETCCFRRSNRVFLVKPPEITRKHVVSGAPAVFSL